MPFKIDFFIEYEGKEYLVKIDNSKKAIDKQEVLILPESKEEFTIMTFLIDKDILIPIKIVEQKDQLKKIIGDAVKEELNLTFFANPYFDSLLIFLPLEVLTTHDQYKIFQCNNCKHSNLYEKKENKTTYIEKIKMMLSTYLNKDWPYKKRLLVQCAVSMKAADLKKVDVDNLSKTILDALKGTVYEDDVQVNALTCEKVFVRGQKSLMVAIRELEDEERPIFQQHFYSGNSSTWLEEDRKKSLTDKFTYFICVRNL